jgi:hypothetical protein
VTAQNPDPTAVPPSTPGGPVTQPIPGPYPPRPPAQPFDPGPPPAAPPVSGPPTSGPPISGPPVSGPPVGHPPPPGGSRKGMVIAVLVAALALVIALVAGGFAIYFKGRADGAGQNNAADRQPTPGQNQPTATAAPASTPTDTPATTAPTPGTAPTPAELDPKAKYDPAYPQTNLILNPSACSSVYIDLDEPRVNVDATHGDLTVRTGCGHQQPTFELGGQVLASRAADANATPNDCARGVQTGPLSNQNRIPITAQPPLVLCVVTSPQAAFSQGIPRKVVLLQIKGISQDQTVDVVVTAWKVPN